MWENNENVLSTYSQKVMEVAQVPSMMADDVKDIMATALTSRYGSEGSKATMQWIKEQNPSVDAGMYKKIQQVIEAGRDEFKVSQTQLIDVKRNYETALGTFWRGMWMRMAGWPKLDLDDYKIISSTYAQKTFKEGKEDGPIKLR